MHWQKYKILLPPFVLVGLLLAFYLPLGKKHYAIGVAVVFWIFYYSWSYFEKRRKKAQK